MLRGKLSACESQRAEQKKALDKVRRERDRDVDELEAEMTRLKVISDAMAVMVMVGEWYVTGACVMQMCVANHEATASRNEALAKSLREADAQMEALRSELMSEQVTAIARVWGDEVVHAVLAHVLLGTGDR